MEMLTHTKSSRTDVLNMQSFWVKKRATPAMDDAPIRIVYICYSFLLA